MGEGVCAAAALVGVRSLRLLWCTGMLVVMFGIGIYRVTAPNPTTDYRLEGRSVRRLLRLIALLCAALVALGFIAWAGGRPDIGPNLAFAPLVLAGGLALLLLLLHAARLLAAAQSHGAARGARYLAALPLALAVGWTAWLLRLREGQPMTEERWLVEAAILGATLGCVGVTAMVLLFVKAELVDILDRREIR